jgi:hypothetical protein
MKHDEECGTDGPVGLVGGTDRPVGLVGGTDRPVGLVGWDR